jgi:hypothetical protein
LIRMNFCFLSRILLMIVTLSTVLPISIKDTSNVVEELIYLSSSDVNMSMMDELIFLTLETSKFA